MLKFGALFVLVSFYVLSFLELVKAMIFFFTLFEKYIIALIYQKIKGVLLWHIILFYSLANKL